MQCRAKLARDNGRLLILNCARRSCGCESLARKSRSPSLARSLPILLPPSLAVRKSRAQSLSRQSRLMREIATRERPNSNEAARLPWRQRATTSGRVASSRKRALFATAKRPALAPVLLGCASFSRPASFILPTKPTVMNPPARPPASVCAPKMLPAPM